MTTNQAAVPVPIEPRTPEPVGRLGRGIVWSDLVAEMEREWARRDRENHDVREDRRAA
ncbi:DUF6222 family protein [Amycolatopsis sp. NPDC051061]|uniref:DUF6222 family protein n=1 Tax=Amycolatopsis sp. NPDC051061 TaxID=3155042 RepID=UPI00343A2A92